jgi:hypothetical protein
MMRKTSQGRLRILTQVILVRTNKEKKTVKLKQSVRVMTRKISD